MKSFVWSLDMKKINPLNWWKGICGSTRLCKIASAILSLHSSSASTERLFSTYSFIHTKKRNKLTNDRAGKLLYIHQNRNILRKTQSHRGTTNDKSNYSDTKVNTTDNLHFDLIPSTSNILEKDSSSEEEWDTDNLVDNSSMDTDSFSSRSDFEKNFNHQIKINIVIINN